MDSLFESKSGWCLWRLSFQMSLWCDKYRPKSFDELDYQLEQAALLQTLVKSLKSIGWRLWESLDENFRWRATIFLICSSLVRVVQGKRLESNVFCVHSTAMVSTRWDSKKINSKHHHERKWISPLLVAIIMCKRIPGRDKQGDISPQTDSDHHSQWCGYLRSSGSSRIDQDHCPNETNQSERTKIVQRSVR